jgi:hypothetical protein
VHIGRKLQTVDLYIFVDNSIETFANGVFCFTTTIYPIGDDVNEIGYFVKGRSGDYGGFGMV